MSAIVLFAAYRTGSKVLRNGVPWSLAAAITVAAILGRLLSGLPVGNNINRLSVGIGMIPRGEVGLIFAGIGKGLGVIQDAVFSAIVIMIIITTLITPILLKWSLESGESRQ